MTRLLLLFNLLYNVARASNRNIQSNNVKDEKYKKKKKKKMKKVKNFILTYFSVSPGYGNEVVVSGQYGLIWVFST